MVCELVRRWYLGTVFGLRFEATPPCKCRTTNRGTHCCPGLARDAVLRDGALPRRPAARGEHDTDEWLWRAAGDRGRREDLAASATAVRRVRAAPVGEGRLGLLHEQSLPASGVGRVAARDLADEDFGCRPRVRRHAS